MTESMPKKVITINKLWKNLMNRTVHHLDVVQDWACQKIQKTHQECQLPGTEISVINASRLLRKKICLYSQKV